MTERPGVTLVDYGLGNIAAFRNVFQRLGIPASAASTAAELGGARRLILPGVGHFDQAMDRLDGSGLRATLDRLVLEQDVPVLGVCVGMQMMGLESEEGSRPGLGWIPGSTARLQASDRVPLPHMGWNEVRSTARNLLLQGGGQPLRFYFLHSFAFHPHDGATPLGVTTYGDDFCSAVRFGLRFGVQFHPEKSHEAGIRLLKAYAEGALA